MTLFNSEEILSHTLWSFSLASQHSHVVFADAFALTNISYSLFVSGGRRANPGNSGNQSCRTGTHPGPNCIDNKSDSWEGDLYVSKFFDCCYRMGKILWNGPSTIYHSFMAVLYIHEDITNLTWIGGMMRFRWTGFCLRGNDNSFRAKASFKFLCLLYWKVNKSIHLYFTDQ